MTPLHDFVSDGRGSAQLSVRPEYSGDAATVDLPRYRLPDGEMPPQAAYQVVHDELLLDTNARLNLATFVTTWMEPEAEKLLDECMDKNLIDKDQYAVTAELESRCVNILADLWSAPDGTRAQGCSTVGSSEACMLAGLAFKFRWRNRRGDGGARPNLVMGANVQVVWEKFCRYWDVEPRKAKLGPGRTHLTADRAVELCDENTIGVVAILGSTFDGTYEPVEEIAGALDRLQGESGWDIPLHVDAATGRLHRALPRPCARVGLPHPARAVDQHVRAQVGPRLPGRRLDPLARRGCRARRARLRRRLPGRRPADVHAELLAARR